MVIGVLVLPYLINQFSYYSDYFYQSRSGIFYSIRGGPSDSGLGCGFSYVYLYRDAGHMYWSRGAALSYNNKDSRRTITGPSTISHIQKGVIS